MKKYKSYSFETKKKAVELYFEGRSAITIAKEFHLSSDRIVQEWSKKVRDANSFEVLKNRRGRKKQSEEKRKETLEEENERLRIENLYLKKLLELRKG